MIIYTNIDIDKLLIFLPEYLEHFMNRYSWFSLICLMKAFSSFFYIKSSTCDYTQILSYNVMWVCCLLFKFVCLRGVCHQKWQFFLLKSPVMTFKYMKKSQNAHFDLLPPPGPPPDPAFLQLESGENGSFTGNTPVESILGLW